MQSDAKGGGTEMFLKSPLLLIFLLASAFGSSAPLAETPMEAAKEMLAEASVADQQCGTTRQMAIAFDLIDKLGIARADLMREDLSSASNQAEANLKSEGRAKFCARIADENALKLHYELTK